MAITSDFISPWPQTHALFLNDIYFYMLSAAKSLQSCSTLCDPIDGSPPGSPVPGVLQARTLEWVVISFHFHPAWVCVKSLQSCPTLCDPMNCSLPGSSVHRILQARIPYSNELPFPSPGVLPNPGIQPGTPTLQHPIQLMSFIPSCCLYPA